jgi:hypothetical protein
MEKPILATLEV